MPICYLVSALDTSKTLSNENEKKNNDIDIENVFNGHNERMNKRIDTSFLYMY